MTAPETDAIDRVQLLRGWVIGFGIVAILLGVVALFFPGATLLTIAIVFGLYLVASGIYRITAAVTDHRYTRGTRLLTGVLGGLIVVAGVLALSNPFASLETLAIFIGLGWLVEGAAGLVAFSSLTGRSRWLVLASALVSVVAGVVMLILPVFGLQSLVTVGAILLIALGVVALIELPGRRRSA
ncbi:HdeD family acid-resistance protein [Amnibacterium endophyticum]|uniref:HdeD family acid-resistance protein n=1 Tax=Amnibacterium endophyticum TaxID=2109337 RepID=A0ABW4LDP3_9MICO